MSGAPLVQAEKPIVLFDGMCNLCTGSVGFILRHERGPDLRFASLQSEMGRKIASRFEIADPLGSVILVEGDRCYTRSTAALRIAKWLKWPWRWLRILLLVPRPVRNWAYDFVARRRYRWFGKRQSCMTPTEELTSRFI